jgi:hypothetical protein
MIPDMVEPPVTASAPPDVIAVINPGTDVMMPSRNGWLNRRAVASGTAVSTNHFFRLI